MACNHKKLRKFRSKLGYEVCHYNGNFKFKNGSQSSHKKVMKVKNLRKLITKLFSEGVEIVDVFSNKTGKLYRYERC